MTVEYYYDVLYNDYLPDIYGESREQKQPLKNTINRKQKPYREPSLYNLLLENETKKNNANKLDNQSPKFKSMINVGKAIKAGGSTISGVDSGLRWLAEYNKDPIISNEISQLLQVPINGFQKYPR
jgi:hypothetical protein